MIKYILPIALYLCIPKLSAQTSFDSIKKNSIYVELAGSAGLFYNVTYDRMLFGGDKIRVSAALGFQYANLEPDLAFESDYTMSPQVNLLFGRKHYVEIGVGAFIRFGADQVVYPFRFGYRYQREQGGFFLESGLYTSNKFFCP
jgi:hypothetical protein